MKKLAAVFIVMLLYGVSYYKGGWIRGLELDKAVIPGGETAGYGKDTDFFIEDFVNPSSGASISHVSSLAWLGKGKVACVWYGGSREGAKDVNIYFSVYDEAARRWSEEKVLVSRETSSMELGRHVRKVGNAVIFADREGRLWLFYVSITFGGWSGSSLNYKVSLDGGSTWTPSKKLILSPFINLSNLVKNKPLLLEGGGFLLPVYHEFIYKFPELVFAAPEDNGLRYIKRRMSSRPGALQPSVIASEDGTLTAYFRNSRGEVKNYVLSSKSADNGATWSKPESTVLPNPDSGLDLASAPGGRIVIALNDTFGGRFRLALYSSEDYGKNWKKVMDLENEKGKEFSYPSIIRTPDGVYHVTYTYDRGRIKHVTFSDAWLLENEP